MAATSCQVPPEVLLRMSQLARAVERGRGPAKLKDSFFVEDIARVDTTSQPELFPGPQQWARTLLHRIDMVIIRCWWLLRGIEAATVSLDQAWTEITHSSRTAFITLPCAKTDIVGLCVTRSHPRCCHITPKLCPFRALQRHLDLMHTLECDSQQRTTISWLTRSAPHTSRDDVVIFRSVIEATGATRQRPGPGGALMDRYCEHVCRVSGSQMLPRRGFPLDTVQLIGRWESDIKVYVQEAPVHRGEAQFRSRSLNKSARWSSMTSRHFDESSGSSTP